MSMVHAATWDHVGIPDATDTYSSIWGLCWCLRSASHLEVMMRSVICAAMGDHGDVHDSLWVSMDVCVTVGGHVEVHDSCCCWLSWAMKHLGWCYWGLPAPSWELRTLRSIAFTTYKGKWSRWRALGRVLKVWNGDVEVSSSLLLSFDRGMEKTQLSLRDWPLGAWSYANEEYMGSTDYSWCVFAGWAQG